MTMNKNMIIFVAAIYSVVVAGSLILLSLFSIYKLSTVNTNLIPLGVGGVQLLFCKYRKPLAIKLSIIINIVMSMLILGYIFMPFENRASPVGTELIAWFCCIALLFVMTIICTLADKRIRQI